MLWRPTKCAFLPGVFDICALLLYVCCSHNKKPTCKLASSGDALGNIMIVILSENTFFAKPGAFSHVIIRLKKIGPACKVSYVFLRCGVPFTHSKYALLYF